MRISYFINATKNKPRKPLTFRINADPGAKYYEKRKKGCKMQKREMKYLAVHFSFFALCDRFYAFCNCFCTFCNHFCIFRDKCIVGLKNYTLRKIMMAVTPAAVPKDE